MFFEMAIFSLMTLLIGRLGVDSVAAHQIASNVGGITYMIPMSVGMAATIRVGFNVGAGDLVRARVAGIVAIGSSLLFALLAASVVLVFRDAIPLLYTNDPGVLAVATQLLVLIAIYQVFDDGQATIIGVLRGYKDTRIPLFVTLLAYWAFSLPVGAVFGFGIGTPALGVSGFWLGLILGLVLVAITLGARFVWLSAARRSDPRLRGALTVQSITAAHQRGNLPLIRQCIAGSRAPRRPIGGLRVCGSGPSFAFASIDSMCTRNATMASSSLSRNSGFILSGRPWLRQVGFVPGAQSIDDIEPGGAAI